MYSDKPILFIEDDQIDQMTVQKAFNELQIKNELVIRENGEQALDYLLNHKRPCLIILDLNMPKMNGLEFLNMVKKDKIYKKIPIIVFTTSDEMGEKMKAYDKCIVGYIVKPSDYEKIVETFRTINHYWTISEGPMS